MKQRSEKALLTLALNHVAKLLCDSGESEIPAELAENATLREIDGYIRRTRQTLSLFATGDFTTIVKDRGVLAGQLKALQANMRHMIWQVKQIEEGDFSQRVEFLGEFSQSFNSMVEQLDNALTAMRNKEKELTELSHSLEREIVKRNQALKALEKSQEEFRYLAERDPLTGVFNRRSFFDFTLRELEHRQDAENIGCLLMLDVDFFKKFNDSYGHIEGDKALKHVAALSSKGLRQSDVMARFGGEEFIFFLPGADCSQGVSAAERIRRSIAENAVPINTGESVPVTVSVGVTCIAQENKAPVKLLLEKAIEAADTALYAAKAKGRNQVCLALLEGSSPGPSIVPSEK